MRLSDDGVLKFAEPSEKMDFIEDLDVFNIIKGLDMKFDCIIMNPPYQKNLHLKVLAEAIKHLKDDGVCVNLSPVRWLQDPFAKYKKNSDYNKFRQSISEKLTDVVVIPKLEAQKYFPSTVMGADLAVYVARNIGGFDVDSLVNPIFKKILKKQITHPVFDEKQKDGFRVRIAIIACNGGSGNNRKTTMATLGRMLWFENGMRDGKPWYESFGRNQYTKTTPEIPYSIKFDTQVEAENFCRQFDTVFCKVYTHLIKRDVHVTPEIVLWMGDAVNPRTGLKGYQGEWTDEDFYRYFELTDDEIKTVEDTMKKYDSK